MQFGDRHNDDPPQPESEADADGELEAEKDTPSSGQMVGTEGAALLYLVGRSSPSPSGRDNAVPLAVPKSSSKPTNDPAMPAPPMQQIDEYRIVEPLGRGGMGQVFLGRDTLLDRPVAVKFLSAHAPNERLRKRFLVEARAIAKVQHPNVLAVYRVGISSGLPYLVTEHVAGASLDRVPKPMPWEKVLRIGIDLLRGLSAVHKQGVLHRDLKPANAMLTPEGTAKLLDFGLAKLAVELGELPAEFSRSIERKANSGETAALATQLAQRELSARVNALSSTYMSGEPETAPPANVAAHVEAKSDRHAETADAVAVDEDEDEDEDAQDEALQEEAAGPSAIPERPLTETGRLLGTPAYMPPEMWLGAPATEQSDLYMFGELLYELCCGHPPHAFRQRIELRRAAIHSDASSVLQDAPTVNPRFAALIDQCIRRSPSERPRSAAALLSELEAIAADPTDEATKRRRRRSERLKRAVPLSLAFIALLFSLSQLVKNTRQPIEPTISAATPRPRVAVLGLRSEEASSESLAGFARAFSDLLTAELSAGERLLVLPSASVDHAKLELGLDGHAPSAEGLARLTRSMSLDIIASGVLRVDKQNPKLLHVEVTLQDAHTRQITARADVTGPAEELFSLVSTAGGTLRKGLGIVELSGSSRTQLKASHPASQKVAEHFAEAKTRFGHFEYAAAHKLFASVVAAEPDFPLGHLGLADVLLALGYEEKARAAVGAAYKLSGRLPRAERTLIEARYHETTGDFTKAFGLYNALRTSFPDDAEYGFYLTDAQRRAGLPADALNTVAELRRLNLQGASAARVDLAAAKAQMELSRFTAALESIEHAAQQAESVGSPLLLAEILFHESAARTNLNEPAKALRSAEKARELFAAMGNLYGEVEALVAQSNAASALGDYAQASAIDERTLQLALELGHTQLTATQLGNMADLLCLRGRLELSTARAQAGLILAEQIGMREAILQALVTLAQAALLRGDLTLAEQHLMRAQRELPTPDDPRMAAWVAWHRAELRIAQGRMEEGLELHQSSLTQREQNGLDGFAAESQAALATLALLREQPAEAARLAQAAQQRFVASQNQDSAAWAQALLSQALAEQGQIPAALAAFTPALSRLAASQNLILRVRGISALSATAVHLPLSKDLQTQLRTQLTAVITQAQNSEFAPAEIELTVRKLALDHVATPRNAARHEACDMLLRAREKGWRKAAMLATAACSPTETNSSAATRTPL